MFLLLLLSMDSISFGSPLVSPRIGQFGQFNVQDLVGKPRREHTNNVTIPTKLDLDMMDSILVTLASSKTVLLARLSCHFCNEATSDGIFLAFAPDIDSCTISLLRGVNKCHNALNFTGSGPRRHRGSSPFADFSTAQTNSRFCMLFAIQVVPSYPHLLKYNLSSNNVRAYKS